MVERGRRTGDFSRLLGLETYVRDHLSVALEMDPCPFHFTAGAEPKEQQISLLVIHHLSRGEVPTDCSAPALALWPRNDLSTTSAEPHMLYAER